MNLKQVVVNGEKLNVSGGSGGESLPIGSVILWAGTLETIPTGWHLCNGEDGTFDLRNMFALGAGGTYNLGDEGGEETHKLTVAELASHNHKYKKTYSGANRFTSQMNGVAVLDNMEANSDTTTNAGSSQPHNNMPPYKALYYIQKIA